MASDLLQICNRLAKIDVAAGRLPLHAPRIAGLLASCPIRRRTGSGIAAISINGENAPAHRPTRVTASCILLCNHHR